MQIAPYAASVGFRGRIFTRTVDPSGPFSGSESELFETFGFDLPSLTAWLTGEDGKN